MKINYEIRDEELQYNINRKAVKISALSSGKVDKYEYFTGENMLSSDQSGMTQLAKFTNFPFRKLLKSTYKQLKTNTKSK